MNSFDGFSDSREDPYILRGLVSEYLQGERDIFQTTGNLASHRSYGAWLAAEVSLEEARGSQQSGATSFWIGMAEEYYRQVISGESTATISSASALSLRAEARLLQLPSYKSIIEDRCLVTEEDAQSMYEGLVINTHGGLEALNDDHFEKESDRLRLIGAVNELSVMCLALRYTLRETGPHTWLPLQSVYSEDHGEHDGTVSKAPNWDLTIFTHMRPDDLQPSYVVPIKSNRTPYKKKSKEQKTLALNPDLKLSKSERKVGSRIIRGCFRELFEKGDSKDVTQRLDDRTELLLDQLDEFAA